MAQAAVKHGDRIESDGSSRVWVQPPGATPPKPVSFEFGGAIDAGTSGNVFVGGQAVATAGSRATNAIPPAAQPAVLAQGAVLTQVDNTATIAGGSGSVFVNGKAAARSGDSCLTWDYATPPSPGTPREVDNARIAGGGNVLIGG